MGAGLFILGALCGASAVVLAWLVTVLIRLKQLVDVVDTARRRE